MTPPNGVSKGASALLWIRSPESETDLAAFPARGGGFRILDPDTAPEAIAALARDPERNDAVVVLESGVRGFEHLCARLSAISPAPRVVIIYPKTHVLQNSVRMPDFARV